MGGSMGVTQGMLDEFGPGAGAQHADLGDGARRRRHRRRDAGHAAGRRGHVRGLPDPRAEQIVNQAAKHRYMSGGQLKVPRHGSHTGRSGLVSGGAARAAARGLVRAHPRPEGLVPFDGDGRPRPALVGDLRRQPGRPLRAPDTVRAQGGRAGEWSRSRWEGARASPSTERYLQPGDVHEPGLELLRVLGRPGTNPPRPASGSSPEPSAARRTCTGASRPG